MLLAIALWGATAQASSRTVVVLDPDSACGPALDSDSVADCAPPSAVAYGGWSAWSRSDAASRQFVLVVRSPQGAVSVPRVPARATPFDVELGPHGGGVVAVYSRCVNSLTDEGCRIYELPLGLPNASERRLDVPGGGSVHEPAIWQGTLAFLRRNPVGGEDIYAPSPGRPDGLFEWRIGAAKVGALPLAQSQGVHDDVARGPNWPAGMTGVVAGLTLNGGRIAYVTATAAGDFGMSTLWTERLGRAPVLIDQVTAGAGNVCDPEFLSPVIAGGWLYAYLHDCPAGGGPISDDRFTRYSLGAATAQRASYDFIRYIDDQIFSVVPDGGGAIWDNGEVELVPTLTWKSIARPAPDSLCTRRDSFC
jgi:hypothetical protein